MLITYLPEFTFRRDDDGNWNIIMNTKKSKREGIEKKVNNCFLDNSVSVGSMEELIELENKKENHMEKIRELQNSIKLEEDCIEILDHKITSLKFIGEKHANTKKERIREGLYC